MAVVGGLQPYCPAQCESLLFVIAVNVGLSGFEQNKSETK